MNEIIPIENCRIGDETIQAINARELHAFLEVGKDFSTWTKDRIDQFSFIEGEDFATYLLPNIGEKGQGRPTKEYILSLNMAKELSMVERNEKGKQARQYFIECERRAKAEVLALPNFSNPADAARAWADQFEQSQRLALENKVQGKALTLAAPKVVYADAMTNADGTVLVRDAAKTIGVPVRKLEKVLRDKGVILPGNGPAAKYVTQGYLVESLGHYETNTRGRQISRTTRVTGKGLEFLRRFAERHADILAVAPKKAAA